MILSLKLSLGTQRKLAKLIFETGLISNYSPVMYLPYAHVWASFSSCIEIYYHLTCKVLAQDLASNTKFFPFFSPPTPCSAVYPHLPLTSLKAPKNQHYEQRKKASKRKWNLLWSLSEKGILMLSKLMGYLFFSIYLIRKFIEEKAVKENWNYLLRRINQRRSCKQSKGVQRNNHHFVGRIGCD